MSYETPPLGRIENESNVDYHRCDEIYGCRILSNSRLQTFRERPLLYKKKYVTKEIVEDFEAEHFIVGHSSHVLILEGEERYNQDYIVAPSVDKRTKAGKAQWESFLHQCQADKKCLLTEDQHKTNLALKRSVDRNKLASALLAESTPEISWRANWGYFFVQVRSDAFIESCSQSLAKELNDYGLNYEGHGVMPGDSIIIDFKSCASLSQSKSGSFQRHIYDYGYCYQEQLYRQVIGEIMDRPVDHFLFIAAEKIEPFETVVVNIPQQDKDLALHVLKLDLENLFNCYRGKLPWDLHQGVNQYGFTQWQTRELEQRLAGLGRQIERRIA